MIRRKNVLTAAGLLLPALVVSAAAHGADGTVEIVGGGDDTLANYQWTVTNRADAPIEWVRFPCAHYHLFNAPEGWTAGTGADGEQPLGYASAAGEVDVLAPGRSLTFTARVDRNRTIRGEGTAYVGFADGTSIAISGVELAIEPSAGDQYLPLLGLGVIFAVFLVFQSLRKRSGRSEVKSSG